MNQQPKPGPDYSGQKLSGRSFRGQDLRGANFRKSDLRGVDFREADLTGADFSGARMGRTRWRRMVVYLVQFLMGILLGLLIFFGIVLFAELLIEPFHTTLHIVELSTNSRYYLALLLWMVLQVVFVWSARRGRWEWLLTVTVLFIAVAVAVARAVAVAEFGEAGGTLAEYGTASGTLAGALAGILAGAGALALAGALAVAGALIVAVALAVAVAVAGALVVAGAVAVAVAVVITVLAAWWLSRQALHVEILELDWLRRWSLRLRCGGGTDFRESDLTGAVFSGANLAYVRFAGATLNRTHWHNANNLHLANTYGTVLQAKNIRELMTTRKTQHKDFHGLDLHGLDFSGLNLAEADFTDCNLTGAGFNGADLTVAKLTRALLLGVDLSNARLTGASIGHWNIDKFTRFDGIDCKYVYLDEEQKERHPATGEFRPGEFAKLYQEIAHTVDFLIENSTQMDALLRTLEKLRASYDDEDIAQVQKVERKGEAYKVSVEVPAELEDILSKELREAYDQKLQLLEHQHQAKLLQKDVQHLQQVNEILSSQRDDQKKMLDRAFDALNRPTTIHNTLKAKAMNDHSRKIENSPITNSAVNLGDHAEVNNTTQIRSQLAEIGPLLEQLRGLINQSNELPEVLKQDALEKVEILSLAATQPKAQAKSTAAGALESLKTTGKVATGISTVVLALSKLFGF